MDYISQKLQATLQYNLQSLECLEDHSGLALSFKKLNF